MTLNLFTPEIINSIGQKSTIILWKHTGMPVTDCTSHTVQFIMFTFSNLVYSQNPLTHKQLETHSCIISIVATDVLVIRYQGHRFPQCWLSIYCNAQNSYKNITFTENHTKNWNDFKKWPSCLGLKHALISHDIVYIAAMGKSRMGHIAQQLYCWGYYYDLGVLICCKISATHLKMEYWTLMFKSVAVIWYKSHIPSRKFHQWP